MVPSVADYAAEQLTKLLVCSLSPRGGLRWRDKAVVPTLAAFILLGAGAPALATSLPLFTWHLGLSHDMAVRDARNAKNGEQEM